MKTPSTLRLLALAVVAAVGSISVNSRAADTSETETKIYDESADGNKQIAEALTKAKKDHKKILVQFGTNPCLLCHRLHKLYETDKAIAAKIKSDYVLVMVDMSGEHNDPVDRKYGNPTKNGYPAVVILDENGKQLTTNTTDDWVVNNHYQPEKVLAFLKEWGSKS